MPTIPRASGVAVFTVVLLITAGCSNLRPAAAPHPSYFSLDSSSAAAHEARPDAQPGVLTLIVSPTRAASGFDNQRIAYVRQAHAIDYYANNLWVDPPARMLGPLIVDVLGRNAIFRAVVTTPTTVAGDLRLETEILRLQHEFLQQPSVVRFTLRAQLVDNVTRKVIASREFETVALAPSENPYGGVIAANKAVLKALEQVSVFCTETVGHGWKRETVK
ncbi:MAG: ABC-type transport auxiliary lipoprotein family protein [Pseudomonadota bacterium]